MNRKSALWELVYYIAILALTWIAYQDGPTLRVRFWYHTYRASQSIARGFGALGLSAEHHYHNEVDRSRTI